MNGPHSLNYHRFYDPQFYYKPAEKHIDRECQRFVTEAPYHYKVRGSDLDSPYTYFSGYSTPSGYKPTAEPLYGDPLVAVCKETRENLHRLRKTLTNVDHCNQYGVQHWHYKKDKPEPEVELPEHMRPKWSAKDTIFGSRKDMGMVDWKRPHSGNTDTNDETGPVNKFCYLCTTVDEHRQHLARRGPQFKAKGKVKPRIDFIVPLPEARIKRSEAEDKKECLYKVTVKTGTKPNAATSANVFIRLKGRDGVMKPQQLKKKTCVNFTFGKSSKETFYIKTPILGELCSLLIYHDGLEKKHSWYLEEVEVCDVAAKQVYLFTCRQWLSLHEGDHSAKRELPAEIMEKFQREYLISVTTGNKTLAGTDAIVTLTLFGKLGCSTKLKLTRKVKDRQTLQKDSTDTFNFVADDIGPLQKIRIEHNNSGRSPDWFLEKIEVEESQQLYVFPCGKWIPDDEQQDQVKVSVDLYPVRKNSRAFTLEPKKKEKDTSANLIDYMVTVMTGDVRGAGTDANVYLLLFGKKGTSRELQLDSSNNNFERGMTDVFKIKAEDIGNLKKIRIRHDNTSLAAGWFLDKIIVRRFFTKSEVSEKLVKEGIEEDDKALRRASLITGQTIQGRDVEKANRKWKKDSKKDSDDSESEEESDDSHRKRKTKSGKKKKKDKKRDTSESDSDSDDDRKKGKGGKKKKKFTYGGIATWVTDSEDDSDKARSKPRKSKKKANRYDTDSDDDKRKNKKEDKRRKSKYESDDSDEDSKRYHTSKDKKKKSKYDSDDSDESNKKGKRGKHKKKKGKYDSDESDDSDDRFRSLRDAKKKKSKYGESESDSDKKKKKKGRKSKKNDSDSDSDDPKKKSLKSKFKKLRFQSSDSDSDSSSDSDSDSDTASKKKKKNKGEEGRRKVGKSSDSEDETKYSGKLYARWRKDRTPYCDEYEFMCGRWLATDEDDKQIQRDLKPTSVTTFYKKA